MLQVATYSDFKGLDVVTLEEGEKVGTVDDLIIDTENLRVAWLRLHAGPLDVRTLRVPVNAVRTVNEQAVTIDRTVGVEEDQGGPLPMGLAASKHDLIGKSVVSENGMELGTVRDYSFAIEGWVLVALVLALQDGQVLPDTYDLDLQRYSVEITSAAVIAGDRQA